MKELKELLYRETEDCTAFPVFLVMRRDKKVSQSAYKTLELCNLPNEFSLNYWTEKISLKLLVNNEEFEVLDKYFKEAGYKYDICNDIDTFTYWREEDEIECDTVEWCFWTREEADNYCASQKHNGDFYSYSIPTGGVLKEAMNQTCKREIERTKQ